MGQKIPKCSNLYDETTWEEFIMQIKEMNRNYRNILIENNEYICMALRRDVMERGDTEDWKKDVQVICCKVNCHTKKVSSLKSLSLREFISAYEIHKVLINNKNGSVNPMSTSQYILTGTSDSEGNCVICMDSENDLLLPCLHSFCLRCITIESEYRGINFTCPICKTPIENPIESSWEVTDPPDQKLVNSYLKEIGNV